MIRILGTIAVYKVEASIDTHNMTQPRCLSSIWLGQDACYCRHSWTWLFKCQSQAQTPIPSSPTVVHNVIVADIRTRLPHGYTQCPAQPQKWQGNLWLWSNTSSYLIGFCSVHGEGARQDK